MEIVRNYIPGSEWLYLKIYTGIKTSDILLEEAIQPLIKYFLNNDLIKKWFFIRYNDPKPHLRIRFELSDLTYYNEILSKIQNTFRPYTESGEIANFRIDSYTRELERYGTETMEAAECLFYENSDFFLKECLHLDDEEKIIISLFYIDQILALLNRSTHDKLLWIKDFNDGFKKEFNADKNLNSQLDKKYRLFKPKYIEFIESEEYDDFRGKVEAHILQLNPIFENLVFNTVSSKYFFQSIFHMNINRMFVSNQRLFEMIIYDYLFRYYKTISFSEQK
ncbi:thiopeptide-type bacteriocin biosynthesis protein [Chryseobacterium polytrichastri]|uniref:Thiopeptide-type bacteriocin biosynthesis domain-containing protein n=1 Tax=Chryseobacterium polytrichastri TaxID=1302687 RepID=A0A1M7IZX0_9FLAO|nr:thiopeptide-type bacteriocin biosynthesis protein [Chryseobacterium polytrichastri]SHM46329.1 thiopeptide-type bacteriocin biosynthesis domain-containing protein [Chryseobacterium polytrichastri]